MNTRSLVLTCRFGGYATYIGIGSKRQSSNEGTRLYGFQFEIKVIAKLPDQQ